MAEGKATPKDRDSNDMHQADLVVLEHAPEKDKYVIIPCRQRATVEQMRTGGTFQATRGQAKKLAALFKVWLV